METLVIGDHFIPARHYVEAIERQLGAAFGPIRTVDWHGTKSEQHTAQQQMEWHGPDAVPVPQEIVEAAGGAEIIAAHYAPVPAAVIAAAPRLRAVVVARAGLENVDIDAATVRDVAVGGVRGRNASAVAEFVIGLMLAEARDIARAARAIADGGWHRARPGPGREIGGRTVGLIGFGAVGRELARRLSGFGCRLLICDPYVDPANLAEGAGAETADLATVFRESDYVSLHARHTAETDRFIGREHFDLMKADAYFINTARSRLVRCEELYEALAERRIAGAGLDVHEDEPLPADSPWRSLDNVTLTPHYASDTEETNLTSARMVAESIETFTKLGHLPGAVGGT